MNKNSKNPRSIRRPIQCKTTLALSVSSAMLCPGLLMAADENTELDTLKIEERTLDSNPYSEQGAPYKGKYSADERITRPIAETPQNITVLTSTEILDSGYTDLREIIDTQPGITLGTGENGNAFGDRYIIRGQESRSDVFVDGLRDPGMTTRESFATDQIEITKGPNSSFAGRGTAGGAVNSITKKASIEYGFNKLSLGIGSDAHSRVTIDSNKVVNDDLAVRLNALYTVEDIPDREPTERARNGLALSGYYNPTDKLEVVLDYYGLRAEDKPDMGGYLTGTIPARVPAKSPYVYYQDGDFLDSDVDTLTARLDYEIAYNMQLSNTTRVGQTENGYVVTGATAVTTAVTDDAAAYDTISLSTHQGWQEVDYVANQTNLHWEKLLAGLTHELNFGLEFTNHEVVNGNYDIDAQGDTNCTVYGPPGSPPVAGYCGVNTAGNLVNGISSLIDRETSKGAWDSDWAINSWSASVMDTVSVTSKWSLFGGLRLDQYDFDLKTIDREGAYNAYDDSGVIPNGHIGTTYMFRPDANVYASFATASDINGGESDVGTNSGYGGFIIDAGDPDPERTQSFELGTKWNVNGGKLLATAAIFQITKTDVMEGEGYESSGTANTGENQVRGLELGLSGNLTDKLSVQAGIALMRSEITDSATASHIGKELSNFSNNSASALLKYQTTSKLALGLAVKYESERYAGQPDTAAEYDPATGDYTQPIPAYTVGDLFATYRFNKDTDLRLNIGNFTDEDYYLAGYRNGAFLYKGDGRNIRITMNYNF